ncbi:MAG TPA: NtaA/DmoA family FMN-dependent monooxygenase [Solirubrobacteraceae bacterium]|jgi:FMN-dependent oxidoreductase (nitrilotriacetate monooxygenase family)|nr:NtaA/DmoA family FMN-dependent monooxygenase [Solirubrobacteraceae bacterium]
MHLNVLTQCSPSPTFEWMWQDPGDRTATGYRSLAHWVELARQLESACIDALFFADVHGTYDVYRDTWSDAVRHGVQTPSIDPLLVIPAAAAATRHLGFAVTYSTTYHPPYQCARVFTSLDHLTEGRIAWNIVTSYLRSASSNGLGGELDHDCRYDRADEYVEVVRALWEDSWAEDAVVLDRKRDMFTDPAKVHSIDHRGRWFDVRGPHQCEPSPQRTPVLYQAGASPRGLEFAARHAEVVFLTLSGPRRGGEQVKDLRRRIERCRRDPSAVKVLQGMLVMVGRTEQEARAKAKLYESLTRPDGMLSKWCGWSGVDLDAFPLETPLGDLSVQGARSVVAFLENIDASRTWTVKDAKDFFGTARRPNARTALFGTPGQIAERMEEWLDRADLDGFNLFPCPPSRGIDDICELLVPELQRRGMFRSEYESDVRTLRERYRGAGTAHYET